jgi:hypothetical protein
LLCDNQLRLTHGRKWVSAESKATATCFRLGKTIIP